MTRTHTPGRRSALFARLLVFTFGLSLRLSVAYAQQTPGGSVISNQASATYGDGSGNSYSTVSNTVTVTVANVAGLTITPDGGSNPTVVPSQTNVPFVFTVTNTGNFSDQVHFLANGASVQITSGSATVASAYVDMNGNGTFDAGTDVDINDGTADLVSFAQNQSRTVIVNINVDPGAASGRVINVRLGDADDAFPFDNEPVDATTAHEVRTESNSAVNGRREARGDINATVVNDVQLVTTLTAPAGPIALGGDINYSVQVTNQGARPATGISLPGGSGSNVYIIVPIPLNTVVKAGQSFPAGTLFTTNALTAAPTAATYTSAQPPLANIRRIAFPVGANLAAGATSSAFPFVVVVNTGISASNPIYEIPETFANNSTLANVTDQSGDAVFNKGDGNADFNEPRLGVDAATPTQGFQQPTSLLAAGAVLIGPQGQPGAVGPTSNKDDYTNRSVATGIAGVPPGGVTTAGGVIVFTNTVQNTGNANDVFTLTAPTVPAGFTVEISTNGGVAYTTVSGGGSTTLALSFATSGDILVRISAPAGRQVLLGYDTIIRATSANTPAASNDTIDRLYTGFVSLTKTATVTNSTGVGGPTDPVPGAVIEYVITYTNVSSTGGTNNSTLTASNIGITENGNAAPNNWGSTTDQVVGSALDSSGGSITGDAAGSTLLTDTIASLGPGSSGTFRFSRRIR